MVDTVSKEKRSEMMGKIKATSKLENKVSKALWHKGYRFRKNDRSLFGTPDISIKKYKVVIFIDSCYWHACPIHGKIPKSNVEFWENKFSKNKARDKRVNAYYRQMNWNILRIWEHELKDDFWGTMNNLLQFVHESKLANER
ncbi:very short patch repair endonuclease [Sediminibacillus halophilus]|uniref:Very short patch repair endonuclease n=1 Tax=Sediminibacillus halophilus TaxID=482461 RepID=A0A1G9W6U8_9BACI|nr:very short patch repair endonuclease [Sediminibacillus halophilus]SDM80262.1 DNA mismatch endonuclease, patch repair protein [Sediminibacillus halophilus]